MRTKEEIEKEIETLTVKIEELKRELREKTDSVHIEWTGACYREQHGRPYLAVLTKGENGRKYNYNFLPVVYQEKGGLSKAFFQGDLKLGTVLRGREGSSWKNDYSFFYEVTPKGLCKIREEEVMKKLGIIG